jgi:hypothetical protein
MSVLGPRPNSETVQVLLDTTWRVATAEGERTEGLDRKAASLATFAALVLSLNAGFVGRLVTGENHDWLFFVVLSGLGMLILSVALSVKVLLPKEFLSLGMAYLERFPKWSEIQKPPEQVRGDTMTGVIAAIAHERRVNAFKARDVRLAYVLLLGGLLAVSLEASILASRTYFQ